MNDEIERLLKKVIPKIMGDPRTMAGYDISDRELTHIVETKKLPLDVFLHVAGDYAYFFCRGKKTWNNREGSSAVKRVF